MENLIRPYPNLKIRKTSTLDRYQRIMPKLRKLASDCNNEKRAKTIINRFKITIIFMREANIRNGMPVDDLKPLKFPSVEAILKYKKIHLTVGDLEIMNNDYSGICIACGEWAHGDTEPDAKKYQCESCGENQVYGPHWLPYMKNVNIS